MQHSIRSKFFAAAVSTSMLVMSFASLVTPLVAKAGPANPTIAILTINGQTPVNNPSCETNPIFNPVSITGKGASNGNPPGKLSQYRVKVDWGDASTTNPTSANFAGSDSDFNFTYSSGPHTYATGGLKMITVILFHQND